LKDGYCLAESLVLIEYIEEAYSANPLLPGNPLLRARCRLAIDFINRSICPSFYKYLQEQDESKWDQLKEQLVHHMLSFGKQILENDEKYSSEKGEYYLGRQFTLVDIALIPWYKTILILLIIGLFVCPLCSKSTKALNCHLDPPPKKAKSGREFINGLTQQSPVQVSSPQQVTKSNISRYTDDTPGTLRTVPLQELLAQEKCFRRKYSKNF